MGIALAVVFMYHTITAISTANFSDDKIADDCWSMVHVLPTRQWSYAASIGLFDGFDDVVSISQWLLNKCKSRYHQLLWQHKRNLLLYGHVLDTDSPGFPDRSRFYPERTMNKSKLIILDLDETLLDQREYHRRRIVVSSERVWEYLHLRTSRKYNVKDLTFAIRRGAPSDDGRECAHFVIFRSLLMQLIEEHESSSNFMMYSLAEPSQLIPNLILIELYFNFVHQLRDSAVLHYRYLASRIREFRFDYVIGRLQNGGKKVLQKSLQTVTELIGDIHRFESVFIVDDQAEGVWNIDIPATNGNTSKANVYALKPPLFNIPDRREHLEEVVSDAMLRRVEDGYLDDLKDFISISPTVQYVNCSQMTWFDYPEMQGLLEANVVTVEWSDYRECFTET